MMLCISAAALWLGAVTLVHESVAAGSTWTSMHTESSVDINVLDSRLVQDSPSSTLVDSQLNAASSAHAEPVLVNADPALPAITLGDDLPDEAAEANAAVKSPHRGWGKDLRQGNVPGISIAAVLFIFCLAVAAVRSLRSPGGSKQQGEHYYQNELHAQLQQEQERESDDRGSREEFAQQMSQLLQLQSVGALLADSVGTHESRLALQELWKRVERAKQVHELMMSSSNPWASPESVMRRALDKSMSALTHLYEVARQHGLHLIQATRKIHPVHEFSDRELKVMEGYLGPALLEALVNHLANLNFSCQAFMRKLEETKASLEGLPKLEKLADGMLLEAVSGHLHFIRVAHEAAAIGRESAEEIASNVASVVLSHAVREQMRMYRDCRDVLEERRALCSVGRERHLRHPEEGTAVLQGLDTVDTLLNRAKQLLEQYREGIDRLQNEREILWVGAMRQQAADLGGELKSVLDAAGFRLNSLIGFATEEEDAKDAYMAIAVRASQEAEEASRKVSDIQTEVHARLPLNRLPLGISQVARQKESPRRTHVNQAMLKFLTDSLHQAERNATAASWQAGNAAAAILKGDGGGMPGRTLMAAARNAAAVADGLAGTAELLWLHALLLESLESDLHVSATLAHMGGRVAATEAAPTDAATEEPQTSEVPSQHKLQVEALQRKVRTTKSLARTHWSARDLALTAGAMKNAAVRIATLVQQQQLKQSEGLMR